MIAIITPKLSLKSLDTSMLTWLIPEVLLGGGSPWHCVFGVPGIAMFLQSFPGASAVMEENEDLDDEEEGNLEISTWTISLDVRLLGISTNQQGCHDIQQQSSYCMNYILYFVIIVFLFVYYFTSYHNIPTSTGFQFTN